MLSSVHSPLDATDLFSGGGGSSTGLSQANIAVRIAANHWQTAVATHKLNHPDTEHRLANLSEVDWRTFPRTNILWGSPSCVWHARSGGRKKPAAATELLGADPGRVDRATAFAIIAATEVHQYDAVIVENVPEFTSWALYPWWLDGMRALGYIDQVVILNATDLGMPQHRVRYFAVFTRTGDVDLSLPAIAPVHAASILDPDYGRLVADRPRRLYVAPQLEQITEPDVPHLVTYRRNAKARRADSHPLACITAGGNHHGLATLTSDGMRFRMLTNRECARAQGFPDSYKFQGRADEVKKQIGNAVPVNVAQWLGERVTDALVRSTSAAA